MQNTRIYPLLTGVDYIDYLGQLHKQIHPEWYFEIGSFKGDSLEVSRSKSIAVDPKFNLSSTSISGKPELHLFQMTSDDFFESNKLSNLAPKIDLAFLDGMHLFEYLLRDFIGTEKHCSNSSVIVLHDCIPISEIASQRERCPGSWTGDVWKLVPILRKYRPDLAIQIMDCPPSGLTVIRNLDSSNRVLSGNYNQIVEEFLDETISTFGKNNLSESLKIESSRQ